MIEKVNPSHPDKMADRIAGAIVDLAYKKETDPKVAVEVLLGHGACHIIVESSVDFEISEICEITNRITGITMPTSLELVPQDKHLSDNQKQGFRCGDNGIFKGVPLTDQEKQISRLARSIYNKWPYDGKYILTENRFIVCQSNAKNEDLAEELIPGMSQEVIINPIGEWTGGPDVDAGATNRKLGSDMAQSVTGGGLHGKDLSKADVSVNIYAFLKAQETGETVELSCAIGDTEIDGRPYSEIVEIARKYIKDMGGFEKFAEWGLF